MGNTESNVTSGVKKQTDTSSILLYKLVDLKGGGLLVDMMKRAAQTKQFAELDHAMRTKVEPFLYNKGKGKWIPISKLVLLRNKERPRHKMLPVLRAMENPGEYDIDKDLGDEVIDENKIDKSKYREVCWSLSERGAVGETILHLCMLNATAIHADLAKRLLRFYPKLINDIYISDEYYGENVLHIAIVNEDPAMVKFLLDSGADVHERCFGNFMCPEDQKASRADSMEHEWVCVAPETNYKGYVYWGEYPLSFAACLGQEECYRLMLARGADPDKQDTNGNTVLHMLVIYQKLATFDMAYEVGASLAIRNAQFLTPLTLAAKLARIEMFFHILNIEREIYWQIGSITCAAYPLSLIDTIDIATGRISNNSALNLVVFGDKDEHLELMDGVLVDLLNAKWNTFVKSRFYRQYFLFCFYFLISLVSFTLRPGPVTKATPTSSPLSLSTVEEISKLAKNLTTSLASNITSLVSISPGAVNWLSSQIALNITSSLEEILVALLLRGLSTTESTLTEISSRSDENFTTVDDNVTTGFEYLSTSVYSILTENTTFFGLNWTSLTSDVDNGGSWWNVLTTECRLMDVTGSTAKVRLVAEILMELGAILYIAAALREARFLGLNMFIENLMTAPSRVMFLFSCAILLSFPILRLTCADEVEDMLAVVVMLTLAPYFLFFCRGFKTVGPFVVMIYRMIMGDLLRFVSIYMVFVMGFSQGSIHGVAGRRQHSSSPRLKSWSRLWGNALFSGTMPLFLNLVSTHLALILDYEARDDVSDRPRAYYIIFLSFNKNGTEPDNPVPSPMESIMAMFLMSMTNFGDYYGAFENTHHRTEAKCLFVVYMAIVAILLVNMLIAMMGNTYQKIAETRNEWQRQWARIVLVVERGVSPTERLKKLMDYSQPMSDGRRALVLRLNQSEADKEEMKEILEMKRVHDRLVKKRKEKIEQDEMKKNSTQANSVLGKDLQMNESVA